MRVLQSLAAIAAAFLLAGPALAADSPPPDPAKVAAARAEADAAIARLSLGDLFENATEDDLAQIRHKASGMVCTLGDEPEKFVVTLGPDTRMGDDVTCTSTVLGVETLRAFRADRQPSVKDAMAMTLRKLSADLGRLSPYRGPGFTASAELAQDMKIATTRMVGRQDGKPVFVRASVFQLNGWTYVATIVAPADMAGPADLLGEMELLLQVLGIEKEG